MDTASHILFGATLAGLAFLDPAVAGSPELAQAVLAGTLIGSHAPDFDTVTRLRSYSLYIRHHRGITHSLPALLVWPAVIAAPLAWLFGTWPQVGHLYFWIMLATGFHVFLDLFNAYGVQCFRPFSRRWFHLDILALYDPFLFGLHGFGLALWLMGRASPGPMFLAVYGVTLAYIFLRGLHHSAAVRKVRRFFAGQEGVCHVVPAVHWFRWQFVLETDRFVYTGQLRWGRVSVWEASKKGREQPEARDALRADGVRTVLHLAQRSSG